MFHMILRAVSRPLPGRQAENRTLEYDTSLKKLEDISDHAKRVAFLEKNAVRLRETAAYGRCISNEYARKITIT